MSQFFKCNSSGGLWASGRRGCFGRWSVDTGPPLRYAAKFYQLTLAWLRMACAKFSPTANGKASFAPPCTSVLSYFHFCSYHYASSITHFAWPWLQQKPSSPNMLPARAINGKVMARNPDQVCPSQRTIEYQSSLHQSSKKQNHSPQPTKKAKEKYTLRRNLVFQSWTWLRPRESRLQAGRRRAKSSLMIQYDSYRINSQISER